MKQPVGIILAGGLATRMGGGDKCLLELGKATVLQRVIDRLEPQVADIAINANGNGARFDGFGLPVVPDSIDGFVGPLAGVLAGMDWAASIGADTLITVAGDTPFFPADLVPQLLLKSEGMNAPLVLAATPRQGDMALKSGGSKTINRHPTFGLWPVALRDDLRAALTDGLRKVVLWTDRHHGREALFPLAPDGFDPFFNVNTPQDLEQAQSMVAR